MEKGKAGSRVRLYATGAQSRPRAYQGAASGNKYHSRRVTLDGQTFDSMKECSRYHELKMLEKAGIIQKLERQVPFLLIPNQVQDGRVVERSVKYIADFTYYEDGDFVVEDVKSPATRTDVYKIKRKMMLKKFGIRIREI